MILCLKLLGDFGVVDFMKSITTPNNDQYITNADAFSVCKAFTKSAWMKIMKTLSESFSFLSIAPAKDAAIVESKPEREIKSVADALFNYIDDNQSNTYLIFTDKAISQALTCKYGDIEKFKSNLRRLNLAARLMRKGEHHNWKTLNGFFVYSPKLKVYFNLTDTQEHKYAEDYQAEHDGSTVRGRMHVVLITGEGRNETECMVIHFVFCEHCQSIVITRCGAYGRTA